MCSERHKNHCCGQIKPKSTSSAIFGIETAAKSCKLKRCADWVQTDEANLNFSPELYRLNFSPKLNFSPSTKKTTEYSFELFFPLTNLFWLLLSLLVLLQRGSTCDFAPKTHGIQHRVISSVWSVLVALWCGRTDVRMYGRTVTWLLHHYQIFLAWYVTKFP